MVLTGNPNLLRTVISFIDARAPNKMVSNIRNSEFFIAVDSLVLIHKLQYNLLKSNLVNIGD